MGGLAEAIETIRQEFQRRYGVEPNIYISAHRVQRDRAENMASEVFEEIGGYKPRHDFWNSDDSCSAWVVVENEAKNFRFSAFYPPEQYKKEPAKEQAN